MITPSHNPPDNGGFKYNPPNGGPADTDITGWIQDRANALLEGGLKEVRRMPFARARNAATTHEHDYLDAYVDDLGGVIDFDAIRGAGVHMGVDPLGGAGVHYWAPIAERYKLDLTVVSDEVDPQFAFMTVDWDGKIRMDPSSSYAMQRLIGLKDQYDVAFACDTDHDRHGIVTRSSGLMEPNHYLSVLIDYLFRHRPKWGVAAAVGKTVVSTALIDRVAKRLQRKLYEVPVGFKWFVDGLFDGSLGFGCEESAGASLLRRDGSVWTTDKDGIGAGAAVGRDHRARWPGSRRAVWRARRRTGQAVRRSRRSGRHAGPESSAGKTFAEAGAEQAAGRREDRAGAGPGAGQRRGDRRHQGDLGQRLVCRAPVRHRRDLQDLCGELQG